MDTNLQEKMDFRIEVEERDGKRCVVLVLPRKMEEFAFPYQEGWRLGDVLGQAAAEAAMDDYKDGVALINQPLREKQEADQVKVSTLHDRLIVLRFAWQDRFYFSPPAACMLAAYIRQAAQDLDYLKNHGVRMRYDVKGREGRPTPEWRHERRTFGKH